MKLFIYILIGFLIISLKGNAQSFSGYESAVVCINFTNQSLNDTIYNELMDQVKAVLALKVKLKALDFVICIVPHSIEKERKDIEKKIGEAVKDRLLNLGVKRRKIQFNLKKFSSDVDFTDRCDGYDVVIGIYK